MTEEQLRSNIAKNITELRKASDITQADLAEVERIGRGCPQDLQRLLKAVACGGKDRVFRGLVAGHIAHLHRQL